MPLFSSIVIVSCLFTSFFTALTSAIPLSRLEKRQGCPSVEPNDPNCLLPFWTNQNLNLTFDDLKLNTPHPTTQSLTFTNFTVASPDLSANSYLLPSTPPNYLRLKASTIGLIAPSPATSSSSSSSKSMAFLKLTSVNFGCTHKSPSTQHSKPQNCTLTLSAICSGPGQNLLQMQEYKSTFDYLVPTNATVAGLMAADLGTEGKRFECYNYTVSAVGEGGKAAVLFLDGVSVVEYFASGL